MKRGFLCKKTSDKGLAKASQPVPSAAKSSQPNNSENMLAKASQPINSVAKADQPYPSVPKSAQTDEFFYPSPVLVYLSNQYELERWIERVRVPNENQDTGPLSQSPEPGSQTRAQPDEEETAWSDEDETLDYRDGEGRVSYEARVQRKIEEHVSYEAGVQRKRKEGSGGSSESEQIPEDAQHYNQIAFLDGA